MKRLVLLRVYTSYKLYYNTSYNIVLLVNGSFTRCASLIRPLPPVPSIRVTTNYNCHINDVRDCRTCLTNHTKPISHHITPLVIYSLGGGHTDTHTQTHTHRHRRAPGLKITFVIILCYNVDDNMFITEITN